MGYLWRILVATTRVPVPDGLSNRRLGSKSGSESETLTVNQLPPHVHILKANTEAASDESADGAVLAQSTLNMYDRNPLATALRSLAAGSISSYGGSRSHTNLQPFLCIHFIVALVGIYPSRT
jgi:microcystin-dependent protein